jgi:2,5-diamino-6-(ribosylamino)-4(3H)-pyrimidinone 5'-phosphate reductase
MGFSSRLDMLPFVYINVATTADGKLAPANRRFVPFGSRRDRDLLLELRSRADAVLAGARTVDLLPVNLGPGPAKYRRQRVKNGLSEYNLRVVVSGSGTLNPGADIFRYRFSPIIVLVNGMASRENLRALRNVADEVRVFGDKKLDFKTALTWLHKERGVRHLLCEGGGEVNAALFEAGLVDEIYLTFCPLIFGGRAAPTMADGQSITEVADAVKLRLTSCKRAANELFLVYRVRKRAA